MSRAGWSPPWRSSSGLGLHTPPFAEHPHNQGIMLYDQKAMMVFLQDGHKLEGCECSADVQVSEIAIQASEDAGMIAADVEDFVALQVETIVESFDQHIHRSNQDVVCLF
jgi:hypothetical protein